MTKEYLCPLCSHPLDAGCYKASWDNAKAPLIECCKCGTQNSKALWANDKIARGEDGREEETKRGTPGLVQELPVAHVGQ